MSFETFTASLFCANEAEFLSVAADIPGDDWARESFLVELPEKWRLSFALFENGVMLGYAIMSRPELARVHLHHFMLRAGYRGAGRGSRMINECMRRAVLAKAQILSLKVAAESHDVQRFYARHGFLETGREGEYLRLERALP